MINLDILLRRFLSKVWQVLPAFSLLLITKGDRGDTHWRRNCEAKGNQNLKIWKCLAYPYCQNMRMLRLERIPNMWLGNHFVQVWLMDPINCLSRSAASLDGRWQRQDRRKACVGLLRFCRMSQLGYLAGNVCYPSRKQKNGPKGSSDVGSVPTATTGLEGTGLWMRGGVQLLLFWFWRVELLPRDPGQACLPGGPEGKRLEPKRVIFKPKERPHGICLARFQTCLVSVTPFFFSTFPFRMVMSVLFFMLSFFLFSFF